MVHCDETLTECCNQKSIKQDSQEKLIFLFNDKTIISSSSEEIEQLMQSIKMAEMLLTPSHSCVLPNFNSKGLVGQS